jgi:hypothetical protein
MEALRWIMCFDGCESIHLDCDPMVVCWAACALADLRCLSDLFPRQAEKWILQETAFYGFRDYVEPFCNHDIRNEHSMT